MLHVLSKDATLEERKEYVKEILGFEPPPMQGGYQLMLMIYDKMESNDGEKRFRKSDGSLSPILAIPDRAAQELHTSVCALVINMGPDAYKDKARFSENGPWCAIGDWIAYTPQEHKRLYYRGKFIQYVDDDKYAFHVEHPDYVSKYKEAT